MTKLLISVVSLVLLTTASLHAQRSTSEEWPGFSLNQLETLSNGVFEQLDADENGSITLEEIDLLKDESEEPLSEEELVQRQRRLSLINSYFWTEQEIDTFKVGDTNGDGSMNRDEFDNLESSVRTRVLELGIESFDTDKNGGVEATEFSAHLQNFDEWDSDGNGTIGREELREIEDRRFLTDIRRRWAARGEDLSENARRRLAAAVAERERRAAELKQRAADESDDD